MRFSVAELLDEHESQKWIEEPKTCSEAPGCGGEEARYCRTTKTSRLQVYRRWQVDKTYNL